MKVYPSYKPNNPYLDPMQTETPRILPPFFGTILDAAEKLGSVVFNRIERPLGAKRETKVFKSTIMDGDTFQRVKSGAVNNVAPKRRESYKTSLPDGQLSSWNNATAQSEEMRDCVQECALVLISSGWESGQPLPWLKCFSVCRIMLRVDRKGERNMAEIDLEHPEPFANVYADFGATKKERRKTVRELVGAIKKHCATLKRKRHYTETTLRGTLASMVKRATGSGWIDCPAFLNPEGDTKSDKALEFQIGKFLREMRAAKALPETEVAKEPETTAEHAFAIVAEDFLLAAVGE